jgi:hypothetical protein
MMGMNWKYRGIVALVLLLSMVVGLAAPATPASAEQKGWLFINLGSHEIIKEYQKGGNQVEMSIYQVAVSDGKGGWTINSPFTAYGNQIKDAELLLRLKADDSGIQSILKDADFRKIAKGSKAYQTERLNEDNEFLFTHLDSGIYYALMTKGPDNLLVQSPLVPIPYLYGTNNELFSLRVEAKVLEYYPLTVTKHMAGRDFQEGDKFTFTLTASKGAPLPKDDAGNDVTEVTIEPKSGSNAEVRFGNIVFTQADASDEGKKYVYTIREKASGEDEERFKSQYITPVDPEQTVTVTVKKAEGGKLEVTGINEKNQLVFTNRYNFKTWIPLTAFKELQGRDFMQGDKWTFIVLPKENDAPRLKDSEDADQAKNARPVTITPVEGRMETVNLGYLHFDEKNINKTYHYDISESGEVAGVTNDKTKTIQVAVTYNPKTHEIEVVSDSGDQTDNLPQLTDAEMQAKTENVTFKNVYDATGSITFKGKKTVENLNLLDRDLEPNEFSFVIKEGDEVIGTAYNDADGNIIYPTIKYTLADTANGGVHTYKISEVQDTFDDAIQTDETVHTVRVRVSDGDKHDGKLKIEVAQNSKYAKYDQLNFVNEVKTGSLLVRKMLKTPTENETFKFIVEMNRNGSPINGTFGDVTFKDGKAEFGLKGNESKEIKGIPVDTVYKVTEEMSDGQQKLYVLSEVKNETGTIDTLGSVARFTNERLVGDLTLVKKLEDETDGDADKEFTFTVDMADKNAMIKGENIVFVKEDGSEEQYTAANFSKDSQFKGSVTIRTKAGVPVKIKGLPTDVEYTVTEKEQPYFELTGKVNDTGTITQDGVEATFTNKRTVKPVSLTVTKTVQGAANDTTSFNFTVTLGDWNGGKITGQYGDMTFKDGVAKFALKSGEKKTASGLPSGIRYTVVEEDNTNYVTTATGANGTINADADLGPDRTAAFTNIKVNTPTGGGGGGGGGGGRRPTPSNTPAPKTATEEPGVEASPTPEPEKITVSGSKTWDDNDNAAGKRPGSITIHLFADSSAALEEVASKVVTAADGWSWTFTDLPAVDSYNLPIEYSIKEDPVDGYTTTYSGYNVTNSMKTENTSATIVKIWDDASDPDHLMRPASLNATLYGNGKIVSTVILNAGNGWKATVDDLPAYQNGERITYTWKEAQALGYVQTSAQTDGTVTTITNTLWQMVPPPDNIKPGPRPGVPEDEIDDYGTPLGLGIIINHVGDCFD